MNQPSRPTDREFASVLGPLSNGDDCWLTLVQSAEAPSGDRFIGNYEILEEIRHGGQALVFRARHSQTGREVALKRTAYGAFATETEQRRFEREIDAVLLLQHPGIVTVYGIENVGGVDLLAMEWVEGQRLDTWATACGDAGNAMRHKLDAFLQVCDAVQHAHQRGVIHRDLKPSNILVDTNNRCRVLDFGLARRISSNGEDLTQTAGFVGTPAYAAPEHFATSRTPTDQRSDIYALGVVLYQLLTDRLPFAADSLRELIEQIEDQAPPPPSALASGVPSDLDAIVATAMAKATEHRYATVHALSLDLRRHLAGQTVQAVKPSFAYVASKWIRRHHAAFVLSLLLVLSAAGTVTLGLWQAGQIRDQRDTAERERKLADGARNEAIEARDAADSARRQAEKDADKARAVANFYLDLVQDADPDGPQGTVNFFEVLKKATLRARDHFAPHFAYAVETEANLALTLSRRGQHEDAIALANRALELQHTLDDGIITSTGLLLRTIGESLASMGKREEAVPYLEESVAAYRTSPSPIPRTLSATLYSLGRVLDNLDQDADAEPYFREGFEVARASGNTDNELTCLAGLAGVLQDRGQRSEAESLLLQGLTSATEHDATPLTLWTLNNSLGSVYSVQGTYAKATSYYRKCLEIAERILTEEHPERALSHLRLAQSMREDGSLLQAGPHFERALELGVEPLEQALAHEGLTMLFLTKRSPKQAVAHAQQACELVVRLLPASSPRRLTAYVNWFSALAIAKQHAEVRPLLPKALAALTSCAEHGGCPDPGTWLQLYRIAKFFGQLDDAQAAFGRAKTALRNSPAAASPPVKASLEAAEQLPSEANQKK